MFCNFAKNSKIQNGRHFLREIFFFENWHGYSAEQPGELKISSKSLYLAGFSRYKHFYVLQFAKNSKIQNGRHFWRDKIILKIGITTLQRYPVGPPPVGQKFRRNRSI